MSDITISMPANHTVEEFPAHEIELVEWWTYAGDPSASLPEGYLTVNTVNGKFGHLRVYPDGSLFYVKNSNFKDLIARTSDKYETFNLVKRSAGSILETRTVTISFELNETSYS